MKASHRPGGLPGKSSAPLERFFEAHVGDAGKEQARRGRVGDMSPYPRLCGSLGSSFGRFIRGAAIMLLGLVAWHGPADATTYTAAWTQVSSTASPGAPIWRGWSAMTWVNSFNRIVMWGGSGAVFQNDVVALDPSTGAWTTLEGTTDCPRQHLFPDTQRLRREQCRLRPRLQPALVVQRRQRLSLRRSCRRGQNGRRGYHNDCDRRSDAELDREFLSETGWCVIQPARRQP